MTSHFMDISLYRLDTCELDDQYQVARQPSKLHSLSCCESMCCYIVAAAQVVSSTRVKENLQLTVGGE